jgi:hypothetical protein
VFPVRYELNFYILFSKHLVFKGLREGLLCTRQCRYSTIKSGDTDAEKAVTDGFQPYDRGPCSCLHRTTYWAWQDERANTRQRITYVDMKGKKLFYHVSAVLVHRCHGHLDHPI